MGNVALVTYNYDNISHLPLTITYANGNILTYAYNSKGELASLTGASSLSEQYEYDEVGQLYKTIDNANNTVTMTAINGTVVVWNSAQTQVLHRYSADDKAFCEEINGIEYKTEFSSAEKTADTRASTTVTVDGKTQTTYTDGFGRISEIVTKNGSSVVMRQVYTYASRVVDGETLSSDRISSITTTVGGVATTDRYVYDANGNITFVYQKVGSGSEYILHKYEYDSRNQLTLAEDYTSDHLYHYTYSYDQNGNINYEEYTVLYYDRASDSVTGYVTGGRNDYSYNDSNWKDKATNYISSGVTYDASGNPTSLNGAALTWENGRWLKSYSKGSISASYTYDSNGIRVLKNVSDSSKYTGEYREYTTVDGRITSEYVSGGASVSSYDYRVYYRYDENSSPIGFDLDKNGTTSTYTYVKNIQGDVLGIIDDSTGAQVVAYTYDAWGKLYSVTGSAASTVGKYNSLRYRGYYYDEESGMYYLQSRYYDPSYRRFINADEPTLISYLTQASTLGGNLFAYCGNNPINKIDDDGYIAANVVGAAIGAIIGSVGGVFLGNWLADRIGLKGWKRGLFVGGVAVLVGATAAAIGYFIGPYVAKVAIKLGEYIADLMIRGKLAIGKVSSAVRDALSITNKIVNHLIKNAGKLKYTKTVANHIGSRPYIKSTLTIQNIMKSAKPIADTSLKHGLKWVVKGSYNGKKGFGNL